MYIDDSYTLFWFIIVKMRELLYFEHATAKEHVVKEYFTSVKYIVLCYFNKCVTCIL